jgi:thioredoxin reductase
VTCSGKYSFSRLASAATPSNSTDDWLFDVSVTQRILLSTAAIIAATTANTAVTTVTASIGAAAAAGSRLGYFATSDGYLF